jgi:hypothetical protein
MASYTERLRQHLAGYKRDVLEIPADGSWRGGNTYPHILPREHQRLNLLSAIREPFDLYAKDRRPPITFHRDFHHLNSSQAMCFNLFFPFGWPEKARLAPVLQLFGFDGAAVRDRDFEKVLDSNEGTNFDFWIQLASGAEVLCEVKLSESEFGMARADQRHEEKRTRIYLPRLSGKVHPDALAKEPFFRNYQLLRNVSYVSADGKRTLVILVPKANEKLQRGLKFLDEVLVPHLRTSVRVVYLEDVVDRLTHVTPPLAADLAQQLGEFRAKYLPG